MPIYCFEQDRLDKAIADYAEEWNDCDDMDIHQAEANAAAVKHFFNSEAVKKNKLMVNTDK